MTISTLVTSKTFDTELKVMYPDNQPIDREIAEVERLLKQGHKVEWRKGTYIMSLNLHKLYTVVYPSHGLEAPVLEENIEEEVIEKKEEVKIPDGIYKAPEEKPAVEIKQESKKDTNKKEKNKSV